MEAVIPKKNAKSFLKENNYKIDTGKAKKQGSESRVYLIIVLCTFFSCQNAEQKSNSNEVLVRSCAKNFCVESPPEFLTKVQEDSAGYQGFFLTKKNDTIWFRFGYNINNLTEQDPEVIYYPNPTQEMFKDIDTNKIIVTSKHNFDIDEFRKQNVLFDTVDGFRAKLVFPRKSGRGITGIYIDSLAMSELGTNYSFYLYGENLVKEDEIKLKEVIKKIEFNRPIHQFEDFGVPNK